MTSRLIVRSLWSVLVLTACGGAEEPQAADPIAFPEPSSPAAAAAGEVDWASVDSAMGRSGAMQAGDVYRFGMPRSDLTVTSRGVRIMPSFALGSWVAMKATGPNEVVAAGDLVLTEDELNGVLGRLQEGGVGQTAIHKHLLGESPDIWWTHVHAHGDPVQIARTVRAALELTGTPPAQSGGGGPPPELALDTAQIRAVLGQGGRNNSGVYSVGVPRAETITAMGTEIPPSMGLSTAINFQPIGGGQAAVNGDFVMVAEEVDAVVAALRESDIEVVSIHNHLTDEEPRLVFMHFWATGDAVELARGLRAGLDRTNSRAAS